jgi:hypothetical protein
MIRVTLPASDFTPGGDFCLLQPCGSEVPDLAHALGVPLDKVAVGIAFPTGRVQAEIIAIWLPGASTTKLVPARIKTVDAIAVGDVVIAGRTVTWEAYDVFIQADYLVAYKDILFLIKYANDTNDQVFEPPETPPDVEAAIKSLP